MAMSNPVQVQREDMRPVKEVLAEINANGGKASREDIQQILKSDPNLSQLTALLAFLYKNDSADALSEIALNSEKLSEALNVIDPVSNEINITAQGTATLARGLINRNENPNETTDLSAEIKLYVNEVKDSKASDPEIAVILALMCRVKLSDKEAAALTQAMAESGEMIAHWKGNPKWVDKHSSGGVGDKISLVTSPVLAALGLTVPKMSGAGLGHTGGTTDKLTAIPGFNVNLTPGEFIKVTNETGSAIIGASKNIAPVDKKTYLLRDVTGTVQNFALIAASILSKKFAAGAPNIVLDVKYGAGAFMKTVEDAVTLGTIMKGIATAAGKNVTIVISSMESPLGFASGNANEVLEAIDVLNGKGPDDVKEVAVALCVEALCLTEPNLSKDTAKNKVLNVLNNGEALDKFKSMTIAQGADPSFWEDPSKVLSPKEKLPITATSTGYIQGIDPMAVAYAGIEVGAGREKPEDSICYNAGVTLLVKEGAFVYAGQEIAYLEFDKSDARFSDEGLQKGLNRINSAFIIGTEQPELPPLIARII